jgi:hypothetical protein
MDQNSIGTDVIDMIKNIDGGAQPANDSQLNVANQNESGKRLSKEDWKNKPDPVYTPQPFTPDDIPTDDFAFTVFSAPDIPDDVVNLWMSIIPKLGSKGLVLRTMLSELDPLDKVTYPVYGRKDILLPFKKKDMELSETPRLVGPKPKAYEMALYLESLLSKEYKAETFNNYSRIYKLFLALGMHLKLGADLNQKVKFVVTWTPGGSTEFIKKEDYETKGFATRDIRRCNKLGIKVYNLGNQQSVAELKDFLGME